MKYYWNYERNIIPEGKYVPFMTGTAVHAGLESWYTYASPDAAVAALEESYRAEAEPEFIAERVELMDKEIAMGKRMIRAYTENYPTEDWDLQRPEQIFKAVLGERCSRCDEPYPKVNMVKTPNDELHRMLCHYCPAPIDFTIGKSDLIVSWQGDMWFVEHKTAKAAGATYMQAFSRAHQTVGYVTQASKALGMKIRGCFINVLKKTQTPQFRRDIFVYPQGLRDRWVLDTQSFCDSVRRWKHDNFWPQFTGACYRYGKCAYNPLCDMNKPLEDSKILPLGYKKREIDYTDAAYIKEERR